ncbi:ATP-dependent RNA helicase p62-like, partial [Tropilaelaps mercedesae]
STELCANKDIRQEVRIVTHQKKKAMLFDVVHSRPYDKILIFAGTKRMVSSICRDLLQSNVRAVESHGGLSQTKRERALQLFQGKTNVMVATDVAARGLDVKNISLVLNFDFPQTVEDYVHRIGRTGRSGTKGEAITFFTENDSPFARDLVKVLIQANQEVPIGLKDIANRSKKDSVSFRDASASRPKTFNRLSVSADWKKAARVR